MLFPCQTFVFKMHLNNSCLFFRAQLRLHLLEGFPDPCRQVCVTVGRCVACPQSNPTRLLLTSVVVCGADRLKISSERM